MDAHDARDRTSDAAKEYRAFLAKLSAVAGTEGWSLVQLVTPYTDPSLELRRAQQRVPFVVHLSQTESGFWGVQFTTYEAMEQLRKEHLVLLRSQTSGYFIANAALARAKKKFSKTTNAWKINEGKVRNEQRFRSLDELVQLLASRA